MIKRKLSWMAGVMAGLGVAGLGMPDARGFVADTDREMFGTGDFNGDGKLDVVILDKSSGKYRLGYGVDGGAWTWVNYRVSGVKDATGMAVGALFEAGKDALAFTAADANLITVVAAANPGTPDKGASVTYEALGPSGILIVDIGGANNTPLDDVAVGTVYNDPNKLSFLRNAAGSFAVLAEVDTAGQWMRANRITLKAGGPVYAGGLWTTDDGDGFRLLDFSGGKEVVVVETKGLAKGSAYAWGRFGKGVADLVSYVPGESSIQSRSLTETAGKLTFGEAQTFDLGQPIKLLVAVPSGQQSLLLAVFGKGESGAVLGFDGASAPKPLQAVEPKPGELLFGGVALDNRWLVFSGADYSKFATQFQVYAAANGVVTAGATGKLASMADNDDATVPDIQTQIVGVLAKEGIQAAADMKPYTNFIPGTSVSYVMLPIPAGEFAMGSPDAEADRGADESPQRKVKISPFWMAQFEMSWNAYELFMYPDDERKLRENAPTEEYVNKVSDAVTRPSKPYMEMSFGMGKDGYPAISMTQHAANKFCHWLSAKTGHFYRLPTEAEWEYACRAGTATAYSFGSDPAKLGEFGWFEQNSDFKYQKVGKKKPNPWGLHDMHGNVAEWCLDQYVDSYEPLKDMLVDPWKRSTTPYPHVARGGSYDDDAPKLRSAARRGSDRSWKMRDPQLPKSIWWLTDAQFVGFRIVRPLQVPPPAELQKYWTSGVERD